MHLREEDWDLRAAAYRHLIETSTAPTPPELAETVGVPVGEIEAALQRLHDRHHLVLAPGQMRLWMLHPFSAAPTEFPVETGGARYWANCAWDALGIPAVIGRDTETRTRCAETGQELVFGVRDGRLEPAEAVIHFAVPARHWYDNVAFT